MNYAFLYETEQIKIFEVPMKDFCLTKTEKTIPANPTSYETEFLLDLISNNLCFSRA